MVVPSIDRTFFIHLLLLIVYWTLFIDWPYYTSQARCKTSRILPSCPDALLYFASGVQNFSDSCPVPSLRNPRFLTRMEEIPLFHQRGQSRQRTGEQAALRGR